MKEVKDIEAQSVHVQIMPEEAVESKRDLLKTELHLLNTLKAMIAISELRKKEFQLKTRTRVRMRELAREIDRILDCLPITEEMVSKGAKVKKRKLFEISPIKETREKKEKVKIDVELEEIKKQLEKLG